MANLTSILDSILEDASNNNLFHTLNKYSLNNSFNNCTPVLIIKNKEELINKIRNYVEIVSDNYVIRLTVENIRKIIVLLFTNATYEDFSNPIKFINNQINFYLNDEFLKDEIKRENNIMKKEKQQFGNITPFSFIYGKNKINYGISENTCYIYDIEYDTVSLAFLLNELYNYGINTVKLVTLLPLRKFKTNELLERMSRTINTFNNISISSYPFEKDEYLNLEITGYVDTDDESVNNKIDKYRCVFDKGLSK